MSEGRVCSPYECGLVTADGLRHAAVRKLTGRYAACGAGRIVVALTSRFAREVSDACPECVTRVD